MYLHFVADDAMKPMIKDLRNRFARHEVGHVDPYAAS